MELRTAIGILASVAITAPTLASAQSLYEYENTGRTEARAVVGISIPLGHGSRSEQTAARVEFSLQSGTIGRSANFDHDVRKGPVIGWQPQRGSTLSLTLQDSPRLMLNEQKVATFGPKLFADDDEEKSDGGGISPWLIGGAVVLGVLVWATFETTDEIEDIVDPD